MYVCRGLWSSIFLFCLKIFFFPTSCGIQFSHLRLLDLQVPNEWSTMVGFPVQQSFEPGWESEINFWAPGILKIVYSGPPEERRKLFK